MAEPTIETPPASEKPTTTKPDGSTSTVAREGRVHTGDVLREVEELKRRQSTVERELGIVASNDDDDELERPAKAEPGFFDEVERDLWGPPPAPPPGPKNARARGK